MICEKIWFSSSIGYYPFIKAEEQKAESVGNHKPSQIMTEGSYMYSSHQGCDICIENMM